MAEVIAKTGSYVVAKERYGDVMELEKRYYPLPGYGNNVRTRIIFVPPNTVKVVTTRDSWGGTGSTLDHYVEVSEDEFNKLWSAVAEVKTIEDFDNLMLKITEIENEIDNDINEKFEELIEKIAELEADSRLRKLIAELLQDRERLLELLWREIDDC